MVLSCTVVDIYLISKNTVTLNFEYEVTPKSAKLNWYHSIACLYWHPIVTLSLMQCKFAILQLRAIPAEALSPEH